MPMALVKLSSSVLGSFELAITSAPIRIPSINMAKHAMKQVTAVRPLLITFFVDKSCMFWLCGEFYLMRRRLDRMLMHISELTHDWSTPIRNLSV